MAETDGPESTENREPAAHDAPDTAAPAPKAAPEVEMRPTDRSETVSLLIGGMQLYASDMLELDELLRGLCDGIEYRAGGFEFNHARGFYNLRRTVKGFSITTSNPTIEIAVTNFFAGDGVRIRRRNDSAASIVLFERAKKFLDTYAARQVAGLVVWGLLLVPLFVLGGHLYQRYADPSFSLASAAVLGLASMLSLVHVGRARTLLHPTDKPLEHWLLRHSRLIQLLAVILTAIAAVIALLR